MANAWYWAWRNPDQRAKPFAEPGRIPDWIEETLRYDASSQMLARTTTADVARCCRSPIAWERYPCTPPGSFSGCAHPGRLPHGATRCVYQATRTTLSLRAASLTAKLRGASSASIRSRRTIIGRSYLIAPRFEAARLLHREPREPTPLGRAARTLDAVGTSRDDAVVWPAAA